MKIIVDLEDFWLDDEQELIPELQNHVKNTVIREIGESIKKQVDAFMDREIKGEIQKQLEIRVKLLMDAYLETGKVKGAYSNDPEMTIPQWMAKKLADSRSDVQTYIERQAKAQGEELKKRYDLLFASQIVAKINEQGLLKEDVAKLLLPTS